MAQDQNARERGYIQAFLEDQLSDAGRDIRITGFQGALSSQATLDELTIADEQGIWFRLKGAELSWSRSALLNGRLEIERLTAKEIALPRLPISGDAPSGLPSPEAEPFRLPELPVSVSIGEITAERVTVGQPVLGVAAQLRIEGSAQIEGGDGEAELLAERLDKTKGTFALAASFTNETGALRLLLNLSEPQGGIAARTIGLPGLPAVDLNIDGQGPLSDFTTKIALATNGREQITGTVALSQAPLTAGQSEPSRLFQARLAGDVSALVAQEYRAFFGPGSQFDLAGVLEPDGALTIGQLALKTASLTLDGSLALTNGQWPERFNLTGRLAQEDGQPVTLPVSGPELRVSAADLSLRYDGGQSEQWQAAISFADLTRAGLTVASGRLNGFGTIAPNATQVTGQVQLSGTGITDPRSALTTAFGADMQASTAFDWRPGIPLALRDLTLVAGQTQLKGGLGLAGLDGAFDLVLTPDLTLTTTDLAPFAPVAGLPLRGAANLSVVGEIQPISGAFDLRLEGETDALKIGQPQIDALISDAAQLRLQARRDDSGVTIPALSLLSETAEIRLNGTLKTDGSRLAAEAKIAATDVLELGLSGASELTLDLNQSGEDWHYTAKLLAPGDAQINAMGNIQMRGTEPQSIAAETFDFKIKSLAPYRKLSGQRLAGGAQGTGAGRYDLSSGAFDIKAQFTGQNLAFGLGVADDLLRGQSRATANLARAADGQLTIDELSAKSNEVTLSLLGTSDAQATRLRLVAQLRDLARLVPDLSGAARVSGSAVQRGQSWQLDLNGTGPGGATAAITGGLSGDASRGNLSIRGTAPLALINPMIHPNSVGGPARFDLRLNGPLALSSLSGPIESSSAQLFVPSVNLSFQPVTFQANLAGARAQVQANLPSRAGGGVRISGPVNLSGKMNGDLALTVNNLKLSDGAFYESSINGSARLTGPLAGGALLTANLSLGQTELQIAETSGANVEVLDGLSHKGESAEVRATRARAGMLDTNRTSGSGTLPLDIRLSSPRRIFVRGRGLDAELGGSLRLTGTTADIKPAGRFDLVRGRLDILGERLALTEGYAQLRGEFDPFIRLVAETSTDLVSVQVILEGLASDPEVKFRSVPEMPQDEVLSHLLFGENVEDISPLQAVRLAAAVRTLAGGNVGMLERLRQNLGVDDLDVNTEEDGVTDISVGKYLTENVYSDVTVGSDGQSEINLNLSISPSITARGTQSSTGESSLGIYFESDY